MTPRTYGVGNGDATGPHNAQVSRTFPGRG